MDEVRRWTTPNGPNYKNFHAETGGVEFFRFPFSAYMARLGKHTATVSGTSLQGKYHARVMEPDPHHPGSTNTLFYRDSPSQDYLFVWAVEKMKELESGTNTSP